MQHILGALQPKVDKRDYSVRAAASTFPETYMCADLPPVKNQGNVRSCVAHAIATVLETLNIMETQEFIPLSTNFIYGMQGVAFGRMDSGMYLRDACKIVKDYGDATERTVNGNTEQPKCAKDLEQKLNDEIYNEARIFRVNSYASCKDENAIKHALMNYGPVLASIQWYDKYKFNGKIINFDKNSNYGYHAIMICGWDENGWICQNSWGRTWNGDGKFVYPYTEKLAEVWSFVDAANDDIIVPKSNSWLDIIYKLINSIINLFKGKI